METTAKKLYPGITLGAVLVMAFVLVQPTMNITYAVTAENIAAFDDCKHNGINGGEGDQPDDAIGMTTVKNKHIVKTTHIEKEKFECRLVQGNLQVFVDVDTYIEIYENITSHEVLKTSSVVVTCVKDEPTSQTIGCLTYTPSTSAVPVGSHCDEVSTSEVEAMKNPQEVNTVNKGNIAKTIVAQKEVFRCGLDQVEASFDTIKKVDVVTFTEIFEDLRTMEITDIQTHEMRCVILITNDNLAPFDDEDDVRDAQVESCTFKELFLVEE